MPLVAADAPQHVPVYGGFDYVTVDTVHRRVYAAHGGSRTLLIVDADTGKIVGQVRVGPMAGVAVDPASGHVFTGNGSGDSVSEVDPVTLKELHSVDVAGPVDAIAYDATSGRIYADEDDGTQIFVIDSKTFKQIGTIAIPGHKPEYLAVNAKTGELYQNIDSEGEVAVIDLAAMKVKRVFKTPELTHNHPLMFDPAFDEIITGGSNGVLSVYKTDGTLVAKAAIPEHVDQCDLDAEHHTIACAAGGKITVLKNDGKTLQQVGQIEVARGMHTLAIDSSTGAIWAVWANQDGDFIQKFEMRP